jgi:hypothetical protein
VEQHAGPEVVAPDDPLARFIVEVSPIEPEELQPCADAPAPDADVDCGQLDTSPAIVRGPHAAMDEDADGLAVPFAEEPSVVDAVAIDDDVEHDFGTHHERSTLDDDPLGAEEEVTPVTAEHDDEDDEGLIVLDVDEPAPVAALLARPAPVPTPAAVEHALHVPLLECDDTPPPVAGAGGRPFEWPSELSVVRRLQRRSDARMAVVAVAMLAVVALGLWVAWSVALGRHGSGGVPRGPLQLAAVAPAPLEATVVHPGASRLAVPALRAVRAPEHFAGAGAVGPRLAAEEAAQDRPEPRVLSIEVSAAPPEEERQADPVEPAPIQQRGRPAAAVPPRPVQRPAEASAQAKRQETPPPRTARAVDPRASARTAEAAEAPLDMRLFQEF